MTARITAFRLTALAVALLAGSPTVAARSLVCESNERDTRFCPADTGGGVHLTVQYSRASCRQGSTWGYDDRGIWVSNGCRAQFDLGEHRTAHSGNDHSKAAAALAIGLIGAAAIASNHRNHDDDRYDGPGYDYRPDNHPARYDNGYGGYSTLTCESVDNRRRYCPMNLRHASVDIDRQLSRTPCRHGDSWGWDRNGIWVDDGCRAVFSVY